MTQTFKCKSCLLCALLLLNFGLKAQTTDTCSIPNSVADEKYIYEVQDAFQKDKVLHAEPLYIDLIRDLGARRGEKEWNFGMGINDRLTDDNNTYLIEYEFAPVDRLGLEIELPVTIYSNRSDVGLSPKSKINGLKLAAQYSFYVSEKYKTSMALGYIHEFTMVPLKQLSATNNFEGNIFNPFLVAAKRLGRNFHTLYYGGPYLYIQNNSNTLDVEFQNNVNIHFMIPGTRNFIGVEFNHAVNTTRSNIIIRPQMRVSIADNLMIGVVTGFPFQKGSERLSSFFRIIYEPSHKHH